MSLLNLIMTFVSTYESAVKEIVSLNENYEDIDCSWGLISKSFTTLADSPLEYLSYIPELKFGVTKQCYVRLDAEMGPCLVSKNICVYLYKTVQVYKSAYRVARPHTVCFQATRFKFSNA